MGTLADLLASFSVPDAVARYEKVRKEVCEEVQRDSQFMGMLYTCHGASRIIRDRLLAAFIIVKHLRVQLPWFVRPLCSFFVAGFAMLFRLGEAYNTTAQWLGF